MWTFVPFDRSVRVFLFCFFLSDWLCLLSIEKTINKNRVERDASDNIWDCLIFVHEMCNALKHTDNHFRCAMMFASIRSAWIVIWNSLISISIDHSVWAAVMLSEFVVKIDSKLFVGPISNRCARIDTVIWIIVNESEIELCVNWVCRMRWTLILIVEMIGYIPRVTRWWQQR